MPRIDLTNKAIIITGASSGIGRATAIECARVGMRVIAAARRPDRLASLVDEIRSTGGTVYPFTVDVADAHACASLFEFTLEQFGQCDVVFANAGVTLGSAMHTTTEAQLREIFEINLFGSMNTIRPAIGHMLDRGSGHVLLCSSCLSLLSVPNHGAYTATKAAQHHLARAMRSELHGTGVRVSSVHPIGTHTELFDVAKEKHGQFNAPMPPSIMMQPPERVARAVVRCLHRPRPEVWTSQSARLVMSLSNVTPRLTDRVMRAMMGVKQS